MKKIKFVSINKLSHLIQDKPKPSRLHVPEWYKNTPLRIPGEKVDGIAPFGGSNNMTIKACVPFLDIMTAGYIFVTPCDVEVSILDGSYQIRWLVNNYEPTTTHHKDQLGELPVDSKFDDGAFKWETPWRMETPKGYSTMFVHPVNRYDLPFRSFGGIVETDTYNLPVNFPFQITKVPEDKYIIPKGTPVIQAIPFKREDWKSSEKLLDYSEHAKNYDSLKSVITRSYRNMFWKKKRYT